MVILHLDSAASNVYFDSNSSDLHPNSEQGPIWSLLILPYVCIGFRNPPSMVAPHASDAVTWVREEGWVLRCNATRLCQSCNHYQCKPALSVKYGRRKCAKKVTSAETLIAKLRTPSIWNSGSMCMFKVCKSIMDLRPPTIDRLL
jgi:hypothetical protein